MAVEERGLTKDVSRVCPCEPCKKQRKEPNDVHAMTVNSYSSQPPGGWRSITTPDESGAPTNRLLLGVELETQLADTYRDVRRQVERRLPPLVEPLGLSRLAWEDERCRTFRRMNDRRLDERYSLEQELMREMRESGAFLTGEEAVSLAAPDGLWHPKHDGSVTGPEFASQPASLAYWYSVREDLNVMFTSMLHGGMRSHAGDKAGLHVNISVEAFGDSEHLARFARLVHRNKAWSLRMSQRTSRSMSWCHLGRDEFAPGRGNSSIDRWARTIMSDGRAYGERYTAIHAPGGGRLEFRLPRGTLRIDRFYKNLEWVASMIEFTRQFDDTSSKMYMRWVMSQDLYPDLRAWLMEKFGQQPTLTAPSIRLSPSLSSDAITNQADSRRDSYPYPDTDNDECECGDGCPADDCGSCRSSRDGRCPCGDGCAVDECGACDEPDGPTDIECPTCGAVHDLPHASYQEWHSGVEPHTTANGWLVGPPLPLAPAPQTLTREDFAIIGMDVADTVRAIPFPPFSGGTNCVTGGPCGGAHNMAISCYRPWVAGSGARSHVHISGATIGELLPVWS